MLIFLAILIGITSLLAAAYVAIVALSFPIHYLLTGDKDFRSYIRNL